MQTQNNTTSRHNKALKKEPTKEPIKEPIKDPVKDSVKEYQNMLKKESNTSTNKKSAKFTSPRRKHNFARLHKYT